jgi:hypothetical protein
LPIGSRHEGRFLDAFAMPPILADVTIERKRVFSLAPVQAIGAALVFMSRFLLHSTNRFLARNRSNALQNRPDGHLLKALEASGICVVTQDLLRASDRSAGTRAA